MDLARGHNRDYKHLAATAVGRHRSSVMVVVVAAAVVLEVVEARRDWGWGCS